MQERATHPATRLACICAIATVAATVPARAATISRQIVGPDSQSVAETSVRAGQAQTATDNKGRFHLRNLAERTVTLHVEHPELGRVRRPVTPPAEGLLIYLDGEGGDVLVPNSVADP